MSSKKRPVVPKRDVFEVGRPVITVKDCILLLILTILFAIIVFINLGSHHVPETYGTYGKNTNTDLIIDFGDYIDVCKMHIFLGHESGRKIAISTYNEVTKEWIIIDDDFIITSAFDWNTADINYYLRYVGIVFLDDTADVNEIVFTAADGSILRPVNTDEYKELFDEEEYYPEYVTYMDGTYFDEIYHGRTAFEFIHHLKTYETTHPHIGKILISLGIRMFGMNPFGWRFSSAIMGILLIPFMYLFALRLTRKSLFAGITTLLTVADFMHFSLSREATIDAHVALFIIMMYYFMLAYLQEPDKDTKRAYTYLALSGISMGLGCGTKFTGVYAGLGLGIIFVIYTLKHFPKKTWKKLLVICVTFFMAVPALIYSLGFIPVVDGEKNLLTRVIVGTKSMFEYHSNLEATHYYGCPWYTWLYDGKPILESHEIVGDKISSISIMSNPLICWVIVPCIIYLAVRSFRKKDNKAAILIIAYLAQLVPWIPISRVLFIYHYYPALLFGILIIGYTISCIWNSYTSALIIIYLIAVLLAFVYFYPAFSGHPVSSECLTRLKWLKDWVITY